MMFNRLVSKLGIIACLIGIGVAQASVEQTRMINFYGVTEFADIACNNGVEGARDVIYTLISSVPANVRLFDIKVVALEDDNSNIQTLVNVGGCVTDNSSSTGATGIITGFSSCEVRITITPPICNVGPSAAEIRRQLHIGVGLSEGPLNKDITAAVTVIGSGREFAVLDVTNPPYTNPEYGDSQLYGDLGIMEDVFNYFEVHGTTHFRSLMPDNIVDAAESDFTAAYNSFMEVLEFGGCRAHGSIDNGDEIKSGYYCLFYADEGGPGPKGVSFVDITLTGTINLVGPGNFVFFVSPVDQVCDVNVPRCTASGSPPPSPPAPQRAPSGRMCDLIVEPTANFVYSDGASPANVYWVLTTSYVPEPDLIQPPEFPNADQYSSVCLNNNSNLDGTVLAGAPGSTDGYHYKDGGLGTISAEGWDDNTGNVAALVNGSLWANSAVGLASPKTVPAPPPAAILLAGTTVNADVEGQDDHKE